MSAAAPGSERYAFPLVWECGGATGTAVAAIPLAGMVYFRDVLGRPVYRHESPAEVRWWCLIKWRQGRSVTFRVTRILGRDGLYRYVLPGDVPNVLTCAGDDHDGCPRGLCARVDGEIQLLFVAAMGGR